jgi:putative ABC transport system substrate-binding protein
MHASRLQAQQQANVLRGGKPGEMPYLLATKYELVINLRTARQMGLELLPAFVARADAVID